MYRYHGTKENTKRLAEGRCRCASEGRIHDLKELLTKGRILAPPTLSMPLSTPQIKKLKSDPEPIGGGYEKTFIFAVNEQLEIHVAPDSDRCSQNAVKHETLFHNADVLAAGEICIQDGVIVNINDHSGSYDTIGDLESNPAFATAVLEVILKHGFPIDPELKDRLQDFKNS
jgi:hypothetical protein